MARLLRGMEATWIKLKTDDTWTLMGVREDDQSYELNVDVESGKDVTGSSYSLIKGYQPETSYSYVADSDDSIYEALVAIKNGLLIDDESCTFEIMQGILSDEVSKAAGAESNLTGSGWKSEGKVTIDSSGGDTAGLHIPFTIREETSKRQLGTITVTKGTGVPTFTAAS